ncbi:MAG TPA: hypothetical protein VH279_02385, partial [Solirubrobacteraceae bacterium]|nr:hypothetical protein [Solirubrobacteraceae bacterium]
MGAIHAPGRDLPHPRAQLPPSRPPFFEALVAENIGIGRPEDVSLVFARHAKSPSDRFGTSVVSRGTQVRI